MLAVAAVLAAGCTSASPGPGASPAASLSAGNAIQLPTYAAGDAYPAALARGTLERQGPCIVLRDGQDHLLIWPPGTTATLGQAGVIVTEVGGQAFGEHQRVSFGGGEYTEANFPRRITGLPAGCRGSLLWLVDPPGS